MVSMVCGGNSGGAGVVLELSGRVIGGVVFLVEERFRLLFGSPRASTPPSSFPGPSTLLSYFQRPSRYALSLGNAECLNCNFLTEKIKVLVATLEMQNASRDPQT
nr:hypothetical protein [Tanacetum cinerariifolium]